MVLHAIIIIPNAVRDMPRCAAEGGYPFFFREQKINICSKISLDQLKTVFKCPIFKNGKPSATGVSKGKTC